MKLVEPPMELGETLAGTDDNGNLINGHWLGQIFEFPYLDPDSQRRGNKKRLTGRTVKAICLRNESGLTLLPKRLARLTRTAGYSLLESVDGYCDALAEKLLVAVDPKLNASNGVADDDIFWGVISGPTLILSPQAGAAFNGDIAVGAALIGATASTTGTSVAGRVSNVSLANATDAQGAFDQAAYLLGYAMSALTTGQTDADLLVNMCVQLF